MGQGLHLEDKSVEGNSKPINYIAFRFKAICGNALTRSVLFRLEHMLNDIYRNIFIVFFRNTTGDTCFADLVAKTKKFNKAQVEYRLCKRVQT